ncbi:MAG: hypothetical protein ACRD1T_12230, partial [Acidimicrobiia bacterium]
MRFAVLTGGSFAGRMISRELSELAGSEQVSIFDAAVDLSAIAARLGENADVRVVGSSRAAIEGATSVVSCASNVEEAIGHATEAIDAGVPLVWVGRDLEVFESLQQLDSQARSDGVTIVPGGGWSPGLTNLMAVAASQTMESISGVRIAWAVSATGSAGEEAVGTLVGSLSRPAPVFEAGSWHRTQPGGEPEDVY